MTEDEIRAAYNALRKNNIKRVQAIYDLAKYTDMEYRLIISAVCEETHAGMSKIEVLQWLDEWDEITAMFKGVTWQKK